MDLFGKHLTQSTTEHGEVLGEQKNLPAIHSAPPGDDAVGVGAFLDPALVGPVAGQHVQLVERAGVQEVVDPLPGQHLAFVVLALDGPLGPGM